MCAIVFLPMTRYTAKLDESFLDELATKIGQRKRGEGEALQAHATRIGMAMIRRGYDSALGLELVTNQSIEDVADIFLWAKKISGGTWETRRRRPSVS